MRKAKTYAVLVHELNINGYIVVKWQRNDNAAR